MTDSTREDQQHAVASMTDISPHEPAEVLALVKRLRGGGSTQDRLDAADALERFATSTPPSNWQQSTDMQALDAMPIWSDYEGLRAFSPEKLLAFIQRIGAGVPPDGAPSMPFPYPTDRDGWICSVCHGWNVPKDRVCMHSHLPGSLKGANTCTEEGRHL